VGLDDNTAMGLSGSRAALPIWVEFMKAAQAGGPGQRFDAPANVVFVDVDRQTGLLATASCPQVISESFIPGTEPREYCSWHAGRGEWSTPYPQPSPSPRYEP
jgi:membrane carboxypeptidase/penicillin-binding protein